MTHKQLLIFLSVGTLTGCMKVEGDWEGECENPATGELRSFNIDIEDESGGELEGFAYMDITSPTGDLSRIGCDVTGTSGSGEVQFDFECENGDSFTLLAERQGRNLLAYCDNNNEVELLLEPD